ncbi:MAG: TonB-dependent receptor plug domain-containing protein [Thiotrichaceae bacterium]
MNKVATTLPELLRSVAGVNLVSYGGLGQTTSVFLRGTNSDHVLVLIDGVKIGSATLGTAPLQDIPLNQVERVEIVQNSRSSLYGSEAIEWRGYKFSLAGTTPTTSK